MDQISSQEVFVKVVEVKITQFVLANLVGKHVIDGDQDFMGYARRDCSLINIESPKDQVVLGCGDIDLRAGCHSKFFAQAVLSSWSCLSWRTWSTSSPTYCFFHR